MAAVEGFDDNAVTIVANCSQCHEGCQAKHSSCEGMKLASKGTQRPIASAKAVHDEHWELRYHHHEVAESQINNEHVCWRTQAFLAQEQVHDETIAEERKETKYHVNTCQQIVPHRVDGGKVAPVGMNERFDIIWDKIHESETLWVSKTNTSSPISHRDGDVDGANAHGGESAVETEMPRSLEPN